MVRDRLRLQARWCAVKRILTGKHVVEWVAKRTNEFGNFGCAAGIGLQEWRPVKNCWDLIAGVAYSDFNGVNILMHVAAEPGARWMTREYLRVCFDYPFNQAKVARVTGLVGEGNKAAQKFDEHLGFELETTLSHAHPTGHLLVYRMWKGDCRFLREPYVTTRTDLLRAAA